MNIKELKKAVAKMSRLSDKHKTITVSESGLLLTSHILGINYHLCLTIDADSAVEVEFDQFKKIVTKVKTDVEISVKDSHLIVDTGKAKFTVAGAVVETKTEEAEFRQIGFISEDLWKEIKKAATVADGGDLRPVMGCVLLEKEGYVVGASVHTLYYKRVESFAEEAFVVTKDLIKMFDKGDMCSVHISEKLVRFVAGTEITEMLIPLPASSFPKWRAAIPEIGSHSRQVRFDVSELKEALSEASLLGYFVELSEDLGNVAARSHDIDRGDDYERVLSAECEDGFLFGASHENILKAVGLIDEPEITLDFWGPERGAVINDCVLLMPYLITP